MIFKINHNREGIGVNLYDNGGYLVVLLLVFGAIFFTMVTAFMGFVISGKNVSDVKLKGEQSLQIAEAGLNYYKWFLSHYPEDIENGTGSPGPYVIPYSDPEGGVIGEYSIEVDGNLACGVITSVDIESTGYTSVNPDIKKTVYARYARPNVAEYSHIVNANVWAGPDREIYGPYHSNGFVRMDGTSNSQVTSGSASNYCINVDVCSTSYPPGHSYWTIINGVFGSGPNYDLWSSPVPPVDFSGVTVDLSEMSEKAKNGGGDWYDSSGEGGYYVVFNSNGTYTLRKIKKSKAKGNAWGHHKNFLNNAELIGTYTIPSGCSVLFFEDDIWVEGTIKGKVTVAAARPGSTSVNPTVTIIGNLNYTDNDSGLLLIGEQDVFIGLDVPDNMTINGIFVAQKGKFSRPHFTTGSCGSTSPCFSIHNSQSYLIKRNSLTTNGTVVSNGRVGTKWSSGSTWVSGFDNRYDYYDRNLSIDPPPLTPKTSDNYKFIEWREME